MRKKNRLIIGFVLFTVACVLPVLSIWFYTGFGLRAGTFRISQGVCRLLNVGDLALFYTQWKISPDSWLWVREWLSNHAWSIFFALSFVIIIQSLLIVRMYKLSGRHFDNIEENFEIVTENQSRILQNNRLNTLELKKDIEELHNSMSKHDVKIQAI